MNIRIKDLLQVINTLQNALKRFDSINLGDRDYYWDIFEEELYNPYQEPTKLSLGQLSFDWDNFLRLKQKNASPVSHDLKSLGAILRAIEESRTIALY
jgi:hypothetical protein